LAEPGRRRDCGSRLTTRHPFCVARPPLQGRPRNTEQVGSQAPGEAVEISQAAEWIYTSRVFLAAEGRERGLIRSVHDPDELMPAARELATEIVVNSAPVSVALSRMMLWRMLGASHPMDAHRIDSRAVHFTGAKPDAREGIGAFFEKRQPHWSMSVSDDLPDFVPWWDEPTFS